MDNSRFRQRLIGAAVLVLLAVIFLPMILSGEDDPRNDTGKSGAQDAGVKTLVMRLDSRHRVTSVSLLGEQPPPAPTATVEDQGVVLPASPVTQGAPEAVNAPVTDVVSSPAVASEPATTAVASPAPATAPTPETVTEEPQRAWVIQSGSFTDEQNARQLLGDMQKKGFASILLKQEKDGETQFKIRLGPYDDESEARAMADQVRAAGFNSRVIRIKRWKR